MELTELKELLNKSGFMPEVLAKMNEIMDRSIAAGSLTVADKEALLAMIDYEVETANVQADAMDEIALAMETFANDLDKAEEGADKEMASNEEGLDFDNTQLNEMVKQEQPQQ